MQDQNKSVVIECTPAESAEILAQNPKSVLVDVRTEPEWRFVGLPDLNALGKTPILLEWQVYPSMAVQSEFAQTLLDHLGSALPEDILFLCRSGARSLSAAHAVAKRCTANGAQLRCINIIGGFEGDADLEGHRGTINGWKASGLPWRQN